MRPHSKGSRMLHLFLRRWRYAFLAALEQDRVQLSFRGVGLFLGG